MDYVLETAIKLRKQGLKYKEIRKIINISERFFSKNISHIKQEYPPELKQNIEKLYKKGLGIVSIAKQITLPKRTVKKILKEIDPNLVSKGNSSNFRAQERRKKQYLQGYNSNISVLDALCVGLYWGEGNQCAKSWGFTNSDPGTINQMVKWAIRAGHPINNFGARVQIHPEDTVTENDIKTHWANCGIPFENIRVYRIRSTSSKRKSKRKLPFGTCQLITRFGGGAALWEYMLGQKDKLIENSTQQLTNIQSTPANDNLGSYPYQKESLTNTQDTALE